MAKTVEVSAGALSEFRGDAFQEFRGVLVEGGLSGRLPSRYKRTGEA